MAKKKREWEILGSKMRTQSIGELNLLPNAGMDHVLSDVIYAVEVYDNGTSYKLVMDLRHKRETKQTVVKYFSGINRGNSVSVEIARYGFDFINGKLGVRPYAHEVSAVDKASKRDLVRALKVAAKAAYAELDLVRRNHSIGEDKEWETPEAWQEEKIADWLSST